jgi:hypothetical protein
VSRTLRVTTNSNASPAQPSATSGPSEIRPRVGFKPMMPHWLAGLRIEPPPSLACATGTIPEATAAAAPPLEPPLAYSGFHGLRHGPYASDSVVAQAPSSGTFERPTITSPARRNLSTM